MFINYSEGRAAIFFYIILSLLSFLSINSVWGQRDTPNLQTITNLSLKETEGSDLVWELLAENAVIDKNNQLISLNKVNLTYQLHTGEHIQLTGDSGIAHLSRNKISVCGNIRAKSNEGINLETEALTWDAKNRIITTDNFLSITKSDIRFSGEGLHTDLALKKISIKENVQTIIY